MPCCRLDGRSADETLTAAPRPPAGTTTQVAMETAAEVAMKMAAVATRTNDQNKSFTDKTADELNS